MTNSGTRTFVRRCISRVPDGTTLADWRGTMQRVARAFVCGAAICLQHGTALARTGTQAPAIASFDTRASHVAGNAQFGFTKGGGALDFWGGAGGFSPSSGLVSVEFGVYLLRLRESTSSENDRGASVTATGLVSLPLGERFTSGVPSTAFALYFGVAPVAILSGASSSLALPAVVGVGFPISDERFTLTPWVEGAPTLNVDPRVDQRPLSALSARAVDPITGRVTLTNQQIADAVDKAVGHELSFGFGLRHGLTAEMRLSNELDLRLLAAGSYLGDAFDSRPMLETGVGLTWRWDHVVRAVLPVEDRLSGESCDAVEARFARCPLYRQLVSEREAARRSAAGAAEACGAASRAGPSRPVESKP